MSSPPAPPVDGVFYCDGSSVYHLRRDCHHLSIVGQANPRWRWAPHPHMRPCRVCAASKPAPLTRNERTRR